MPELSGDFPGISQPVLVVTGEQDAVVPVADSRKLDASLPNSSLAILPECGHVPHEECPDTGAKDAAARPVEPAVRAECSIFNDQMTVLRDKAETCVMR
ncbi:MAG: alpha/beta fold hydrolase [Halocynthiibacter sp.]